MKPPVHVLSSAVLLAATVCTGADLDTRLGLEAGGNWSRFSNPAAAGEADPFAANFAPYAGVSVRLRRGVLGLRTGLQLTRKGTEIPEDPETVTVDYLELPVLVELRLRPGARAQPYLSGGVALARRLRARSDQFPEEDLDSSVRPNDLGAVSAIGVDFGRFGVEGRYTHGLRPIDSESTGGSGNGSRYHRAWSVGGRWTF